MKAQILDFLTKMAQELFKALETTESTLRHAIIRAKIDTINDIAVALNKALPDDAEPPKEDDSKKK